MAGGFAVPHAWAEPVGARYDPRAVSVSQAGATTTVSQAVPRAVVDWNGFDVGAREKVVFNQPDNRAAILNRVHSTGPSQIDGLLSAPGRVIVQNANGVMFGATAQVDVGALVATTLNVDERQFLDSGRIALSGATNPGAGVSNAGTITAAEKGLVALVGSHVANSGVISAKLGLVALAAGNAATIDFSGDGLVQIAITDPVTAELTQAGALVANSGRISADGGSVLLTASAAAGLVSRAINLDGIVEARGIENRQGSVVLTGGTAGAVALGSGARIDASGPAGGTVAVTGESVALAGGAVIDASGTGGQGGVIRVGGDLRGLGSLQHAAGTTVEPGALLDASSATGDGGSIAVWSDVRTDFSGTALAEARGTSGQGGLVETSSAGTLSVHPEAAVSTRGPGGRNGTWLLDPDSITIVASGGAAGSPSDANSAGGASTINASTVVSALASSNVLLLADNLISVNAPVVATTLGGAPGGLELIASREDGEIHVDAPILLQNGNLALRAGGDILLGTDPSQTDFDHRAIIAVGSGTVWIQTRDTGDIVQAGNSAVLADNLALIGRSVTMGSADNFTLNLAGMALNGDFVFHETNASGLVNATGTVTDPFAVQTLTGVTETHLMPVGETEFAATVNPNNHLGNSEGSDDLIHLSAGGAAFDTVVFSALPYTPTPPPPSATFKDSSDHFIRRLAYSIGGTSYSFTPETQATAPAGFALKAEGGVVVAKIATPEGFFNQAWGVHGFVGVGGTDPDEIGFDPFNQVSEKLRVTLGGETTALDATYRLFFSPDFNAFTENARVEFFNTVTGTPDVAAVQGVHSGTVASTSRVYGDPNPVFTFVNPQPAFSAIDSYVSSRLPVAYPLPQPTIVTGATPLSPAGTTYPLEVSPPTPTSFVADRYVQNFTPGTLLITPAPLDIVSDNFDKVYGTPDPEFTFNVGGLKNGETADTVISGSQERLDTSENVGFYDVTQGSLAPNSNYFIQSYTPGTLEITPAPLTIRADSDSRVYGDANPSWIAPGQTGHFTASGFVLGDSPALITSVDFATPANLISPVAGYDITPSNAALTGVAATNYTVTYVPGTLDVTPAPLLVRAFDEERVYGEANPAFNFDTTGWKNGDETGNSISATPSTLADVTTGVGDHEISVGPATFVGPGIGNYSIATQSGTLTILPAELVVTADNQSRLYRDPNPPLTATTTGWKNEDDLTTTMNTALSTTALIDSSVGDYPITVDDAFLTGPASPNYTIVRRPGTLVISAASLLLMTADSFSRVYGTDNPLFTFQTAGWKGGDEASNSVTATLTSSATILSNVGDYPIVVSDAAISGPAMGNYTIRTFDGLLTVTPAPLLLEADNLSRLYGDPNPALTFTTHGFRNNDAALYTASASLATVATPASDVGQVPITISAPGLSGPNPANYTLDVRPGTLTIDPAPLTVLAGFFSKVFGDADPPFPLQVEGLRNSDTEATVLGGSILRDPGENVGGYPIRQGTLGLTTNNYTLNFVDGGLDITPARLSVVAVDKGKVYGDPDPALTFTVDGLRFSDTADSILDGGLDRDPGENVGGHTIRQGELSLTSPNYTLDFTTGTLSITPAPLLVTGDLHFKTFGDGDPPFTYTVDGLRLGDTAASILTGELGRDPGENVGDYPVTQGALQLASVNYTLTYVDGNLRINPAPLVIQANDDSRVYGDPNPDWIAPGQTGHFTASGFVHGDSPALITSIDFATPADLLSPVAGYDITPSGAVLSGVAATNYTVTYAPGTLDVIPAPLLVHAFDAERLYGDPNPAFGFGTTGWRNGDEASNTVGATPSTLAGIATGVGEYEIVVGPTTFTGPALGNYDIVTQPGTLTITPAPLLVTGDQHTKVFGNADPTFTFTVDGLRAGDTAASTLAGALGRDPGENVGDYPVTQGALHLSTANYILTYVDGNLRITPAPLTVSADSNHKFFGDPDPILTFTVEGLKFGDTVSDAVSGNVVRQPGEDVGTFPIEQGTIQLTNPNYALTFVDGVFTIHPLTEELPLLGARSFDPWWIERIVRGRDPDTPGDAVYRTTRYENPFIPDPLFRAYGLGGVQVAPDRIVPPMLQDDGWTRIDNDRTGQHADRPPPRRTVCAAVPLNTVAPWQRGGGVRRFGGGGGRGPAP